MRRKTGLKLAKFLPKIRLVLVLDLRNPISRGIPTELRKKIYRELLQGDDLLLDIKCL